MNAITSRVLDMLERIDRFMREFVVNAPRAIAAHAEVVDVLEALRAAAKDQLAGRGYSAGGVEVRESTWRALREVLVAINRTARTLEPEHPGIRATFRLPRTRSYLALIASGRAIVKAATP